MAFNLDQYMTNIKNLFQVMINHRDSVTVNIKNKN